MVSTASNVFFFPHRLWYHGVSMAGYIVSSFCHSLSRLPLHWGCLLGLFSLWEEDGRGFLPSLPVSAVIDRYELWQHLDAVHIHRISRVRRFLTRTHWIGVRRRSFGSRYPLHSCGIVDIHLCELHFGTKLAFCHGHAEVPAVSSL